MSAELLRRLLRRLLERASEDVTAGEMSITKPKELLDAARLLRELEEDEPAVEPAEGPAEGPAAETIPERLVARLERLASGSPDEPAEADEP